MIKGRKLILDSPLLLLLAVGSTNQSYIASHKRLTEFRDEDFILLRRLIASASAIILTPNTLTETSNLATKIMEPAKRQILVTLAAIAQDFAEIYHPSRAASEEAEFFRLGLTDAVLLDIAQPDTVLLTTDNGLYLAALEREQQAINFNHHRGL